MRFSKSNSRRRQQKRRQLCGSLHRGLSQQYDALEPRQLLATLAFDSGTGALTIDLPNSGESAVVDINTANGNVTVNGSEDMDTSTGAVDSVNFVDLRTISVSGNSSFLNQTVEFAGNFSSTAGALLSDIAVVNVNSVDFSGLYDLVGTLDVTLDGSGGMISDSASGQIAVVGATMLTANDNDILLDGVSNNFVGDVTASTSGTGRNITLTDVDDLQFASLDSSGFLLANAGGNVTDAVGSTLTVAATARFNATSVVLGDNASDMVNFDRFSSTTSGLTQLEEDSDVILLENNVGSLSVQTDGGIFDGSTTNIAVAGSATLIGSRIRIGENGTDTFMAGSLNFISSGHVHIWQDSDMLLFGNNTANSLNLYSSGTLADATGTSVNVTNNAGFEATDVVLGDTITDVFNTGSLYFFTTGDFNVTEDSSLHVIEPKNAARRLFLTANGDITDAVDANIAVERLATFRAIGVTIGDSETDSFNAGSINFILSGGNEEDRQFQLSEDSSTNIVGLNNSAFRSTINSTGDITNVFVTEDADQFGTRLNVTTIATFNGANIDLGQQLNDVMNFGSVQVITPGIAAVHENSATHFALDSTAESLEVSSFGALTDAVDASVNVTGSANLQATSIVIGEQATDQFNAGTITLNSAGRVEVTEDSRITLAGVSTASSMSLTAIDNFVTDAADADTRVTGNLDVTGSLINLGVGETDFLSFATLTFNSSQNTNIAANSDIVLAGSSATAAQLLLTSTGSITDETDASTEIQERATFTAAVDIIIGDSTADCFDIFDDRANLTMTAPGTREATFGCP